MAEKRGASRPEGGGDSGAKAGSGPKVRARQPTLIGLAVGDGAEPVEPSVPPPEPSVTATVGKPPPSPRAPPKPASGLPRPAVPKPVAALPDDADGDPVAERSTDPTPEPAGGTAGAAGQPAEALPSPFDVPRVGDLDAQPAADAGDDAVDFGAPRDEADVLAGESTHVNVEVPPQPELGTPPSVEVPTDIAMEPTLPAASMPLPPVAPVPEPAPLAPSSVEPSAPTPSAVAPSPEPPSPQKSPVEADAVESGEWVEHPPVPELAVEPTVVVSSDALVTSTGQTYSLDVRSGRVQLDDSIPPAPAARSTSPALLGLLAGALLVGFSGVAFLVWALVVRTGDTAAIEPDPVERVDVRGGQAQPTPEQPDPDPPAPSPAVEAPSGPADQDAPAGWETEEGELEDEEENDELPSAPSEVTPRAVIDAFELDVPRLTRRARRLTEEQRRRQNARLRVQALRAYRERDYPRAERLYREAMEYNTWDVASAEGLARATARQGRYPEAIGWAQLAVQRMPRSTTAHRVLGDVWRQAGHPDEALASYRRGLHRDPEDRWLRQRVRDLQDAR